MEYLLNSVNAVSLTSPLQGLGGALSRATGALTTPLQRLVPERLLGSLPTTDPSTVVVLGLVSVIVMLGIGYYALFTR